MSLCELGELDAIAAPLVVVAFSRALGQARRVFGVFASVHRRPGSCIARSSSRIERTNGAELPLIVTVMIDSAEPCLRHQRNRRIGWRHLDGRVMPPAAIMPRPFALIAAAGGLEPAGELDCATRGARASA